MHETKQVHPVQKKMGRFSNGERRRVFMSALSDTVIKAVWSAIPTILVGKELILLTSEERGYFAIGGEWIAIIMVYMAAYSILSKRKSQPLRKRRSAPTQVYYNTSKSTFQGECR